ncbi:MAG: tripartite tricarboxylate transporter substrate binding protein [Polaromonas sp.]|uniref:Bug family tripartite tricarboxylate transporter substrate binding protein n=1 Tax=Polaromonas sp. TaxID=1869339 RepID=UPI002715D6E2|nr:tripartite tricarboxylate transporter substrate binding protein [Polaromonas sp.]MDO9113743.1 tripartite tricarboxylate transporter substrate binding protein [Polaromonas sp.]MDP1884843.1 tripartite tricarboxylate transporter substrate binding protein [Polaromonas sp.]
MNIFRLATVLVAALALPVMATAQTAPKKPAAREAAPVTANWPTRTVKLLVGFPGGSTPDMAARTLAEPLSRALGQPVIVENRPGASGNIAADLVSKATDDHTLGVVINGNLTSAKMLYSRLPYDPAKDFTPISLLTTAPLVLVAPVNQPSGNDFFLAARNGGDKWNYGSVGNGSVGHLGMELLKTKAGNLAAVHVPYQGNPQVITALLGGQIQMALVPPGIALPQIKAGKLKAIGLTSGRSALASEIPSLSEADVRNLNLEVWTALVGPARLSKAAQARLAQEVPRIIRDNETRQKLFNQGWQAVGTSPEGLSSRIRSETAIMGGIITMRGIKID